MRLQQPNPNDSPHVHRGGWRAVTLEEARSILTDADLDLDEERTGRLLDRINGQIFCIGGLRQATLELSPPGEVAQRFEEVQKYARSSNVIFEVR